MRIDPKLMREQILPQARREAAEMTDPFPNDSTWNQDKWDDFTNDHEQCESPYWTPSEYRGY